MTDSVFTYGGTKGGLGTETLASVDPQVADLIQHEMARQWTGLELIASENFTSQAVMEACGSAFTNKYSEGLPGARYYGGNEHVDVLERLAQSRALEAFGLTADKWGVNVQPYSGSPANFEVYTGLLQPHDRMMGLGLPSGGHLTHGYYTAKKKISASSIYFETLPYKVDSETGLLDYDEMERQALIFNPKIIIGGASAYPRDWDFKRMREICDKVGAMLMVDMAHVSGLVAAGEHSSPFEYADIVTTTTHKSLRGPRSGIIFFRRGDKPVKHDKAGNALPVEKYDYEERINAAVFPALQGGPHNHIIAGVAVCLKAAQGDEFKAYAKQVRANAVALAEALKKRGYKIVTDGTDNHLVLWDLRPQGITGSKMETVLERAHISVNKNSVHGDKSALSPSGVRLGTPALTSRGFKEAEMDKIAELLHRGVQIAADVQNTAGKMLKVFIPALDDNEALKKLREDTIAFSKGFEMYGFHTDALKHQ